MAKNKKKRNKVYRGQGARVQQPTITRIQTVSRNPVSQWFYDRKKLLKPVAITLGIVAFIAFLVAGIISVIF